MRTHLTVLGWLHIAVNGFHLLIGGAVWLIFAVIGGAAAASGNGDMGPAAALMGIGTFILGIFAVLSIPGLIVGWGLLQGAPWARILGIVMSILLLFGPPFGTALGVYGLVI